MWSSLRQSKKIRQVNFLHHSKGNVLSSARIITVICKWFFFTDDSLKRLFVFGTEMATKPVEHRKPIRAASGQMTRVMLYCKALHSKGSRVRNSRKGEQSSWQEPPKSEKSAEVFQFTHLGPVTPRAQGHSIAALPRPSSVLNCTTKTGSTRLILVLPVFCATNVSGELSS